MNISLFFLSSCMLFGIMTTEASFYTEHHSPAVTIPHAATYALATTSGVRRSPQQRQAAKQFIIALAYNDTREAKRAENEQDKTWLYNLMVKYPSEQTIGMPLLSYLIATNREDGAWHLFGSERTNVRTLDAAGRTPLMYAIAVRDQHLVERMLALRETDVTVKALNGDTALALATRTNQPLVTILIMEKLINYMSGKCLENKCAAAHHYLITQEREWQEQKLTVAECDVCKKIGNLRPYDLQTHEFTRIYSPFTCKICYQVAMICSGACAIRYKRAHRHLAPRQQPHNTTVYDVIFSRTSEARRTKTQKKQQNRRRNRQIREHGNRETASKA